MKNIETGKILPQAIELEANILGVLMQINNAEVHGILARLNPAIFYKEQHVIIAEAIVELKKQGIIPDILSVTQVLKKSGKLAEVGGAYYVTELTNNCVLTNIDFHYHIVVQKYVQREFIKIMNERIREAFDDSCDVFDLLETAERQIKKIHPIYNEVWEKNTKDVSDAVALSIVEPSSSGIYMYYNTGWPTFDKKIGTGRNKIVTVGGASGHGKSRFVSAWMFKLLEKYASDIAIFWCAFEDSAEDILLLYLSSIFHIQSKAIKRREFNKSLLPDIKEAIERWKSFDIHFVDRSSKIGWIKQKFAAFCEKRPDKFPILIIDNLLALQDKKDFKGNDNAMEDFAMSEILTIRQDTHALIIPVHHFSKTTLKDRKESGFRPLIEDLKGSERIPAISNQVLLINNPRVYKELIADYHGEAKEVLKNLFIIDPGKIRDDSNNDEDALIHFWCNLDHLIFKEIIKP